MHLLKKGTMLTGAAFVMHGLPAASVLATFSPLRRVGAVHLAGPARPGVALTFDDGPSPATTPAILDRLRALQLRATFFVLGEAALAHPDLVGAIAAEGHELGLHGMRHEHHLFRSPRWIFRDLQEGVDVLRSMRVRASFFRPSYGQLTTSTLVAARKQGLEVMLWSGWGREWADHDAASVAARVVARLRPGAIILLHDSDRYCGEGTVACVNEGLEQIAGALQGRGLLSRTVSELFR